jgi:hypothetical protein
LIDLCLRRRDWPGVRHHTDALEAYAQVEPSSLVRLIVDRARALSMHAQGCGEVRDELERIAREARRIGDLHALRAIEAALSSN